MWLAVLPTVAWMMGQVGDRRDIAIRLQASWKPTIVLTMFLYATLLHYLILGLPGVPYINFVTGNYFWREASTIIERVEDDLRQSTGQEPIIIGMTKFSVASSLAFYDRDGGAMNIRARNMFGEKAVMYNFWFPSQPPTTQPIILVGRDRRDLNEHEWGGPDFDRMLVQLGPIQSQKVLQDGKLLRHVYFTGSPWGTWVAPTL